MIQNPRSPAAVPLAPNQVWRSYAGGRVLRAFRGLGVTTDDHFPEDWLASVVRARNGPNSRGQDEGLSRLGASDLLVDAIQQDPGFWFGNRHAGRQQMGVLWKFLDSSVRLQFQAHPDAAFARRNLNSNAGKTECWYILATRDQACVYLGFQRPPTREAWCDMIREQRLEQMLSCFDRIDVKAGDCYVVPAGTAHAIGPGVFMVELMEPTDWVVRCETVNAGVTLPPEACFMGLGLENCLEIFDYRAYSAGRVREVFQQQPRVLREASSFVEEQIIGSEWCNFFCMNRLRGNGEASWSGQELQLLIVVEGEGELTTGRESRRASKGQTWLLPGCAGEWRWNGSSNWEVLVAALPEESAETRMLPQISAKVGSSRCDDQD